MPNRSRKPARDFNQITRSVVDKATGVTNGHAKSEKKKKNPAAVALGRKGGLKGGKARAAKMTKEERSASAKKAAAARWGHESSSG
jgi:hypothetical protein